MISGKGCCSSAVVEWFSLLISLLSPVEGFAELARRVFFLFRDYKAWTWPHSQDWTGYSHPSSTAKCAVMSRRRASECQDSNWTYYVLPIIASWCNC